MRELYRSELQEIVNDLVVMSDSVQIAVRDATTALLDVNLSVAERVISSDVRIDQVHDHVEYQAFSLMATQGPVAGELRTLVASIQMVAELGRMGDLAAHVAKIARLRYPNRAVPDGLVENFRNMSSIAQDMVGIAGRVLAERDADEAEKLVTEDDQMDKLRSDQFRMMVGNDWPYSGEEAVDVALLGRYYERIADHAVAIRKRTIYIITGEMPEGEDWPTT